MRLRTFLAGAIALASALALAPGGLGRTLPGSLRITGPRTVHRDRRTAVSISASTPVGLRLAVYVSGARCGRRLEDTLDHDSTRQVLQRWIARSFATRIRLPPAARGTHHVCAYLYHRAYDNLITDVHAGFTFVAR